MKEPLTIAQINEIFVEENDENFTYDAVEIEAAHPLMFDDKFSGTIVANKTITGDVLTHQDVSGTKFYNCRFRECDLSSGEYFLCTFQKCEFEKCNVERLVLRKCEIDTCSFVNCSSRTYFNISEGFLYGTEFENCYFTGIELSGCDVIETKFNGCSIEMGRFQALFTEGSRSQDESETDSIEIKDIIANSEENIDDIEFHGCRIEFTDFRMINFVNAKFRSCELSKNSFSDCAFYTYNIDSSNNKGGWGTNSIDLITLSQSEPLLPQFLRNMFNTDPESQAKIKEMRSEKILSSIFISYSLRDGEIARNINEYLKGAGVTTFLWETDAPGGKPLRQIMRSNIESKDRLLFVASENSLRSAACHFELTEGRQKQDKLWKTLLFPIHLDNFLFNVKYDEVRPKDRRDEYWKNIEELREINSLDFSAFGNGIEYDREGFAIAMENLLRSLKIE